MSAIINTNAWNAAEEHCREHIDIVNEMSRVIAMLRDQPVTSVLPIISIHSATLFVIPTNDKDAETVKHLAASIRGVVDEPSEWSKFKSGEFWYLQLKLTKYRVTLHVATQLLASQPTVLDVE